MSAKPTYLGLLNAVAVGELGGEELFGAWASTTTNDDVRCVLQTVALREGEHARTFAKRIDELGFSVIPKDDPGLAARVATACSTEFSDREKFEQLGFHRAPRDGKDIFGRFFDDITIDIQTGEMLGRYVSEERDTGRRLLECYSQLCAAEPSVSAAATTADIDERLCRIETALCSLAESVSAAAGQGTKSVKGSSKVAAPNAKHRKPARK